MNFDLKEWWIWIFAIIIIIALLWYNYTQNDCINGKECIAYVNIQSTDPPSVIKDKIQDIVDKATPNTIPIILVISIAVTIPLIYYVTGRNPTLPEFFVGALFMFVALWFTMAWMEVHFYQPTFQRILDGVNLL